MAKQQVPTTKPGVSQVTIDGITVTLIFAAEKNGEVPCIVRDILKGSYLQQKRK